MENENNNMPSDKTDDIMAEKSMKMNEMLGENTLNEIIGVPVKKAATGVEKRTDIVMNDVTVISSESKTVTAEVTGSKSVEMTEIQTGSDGNESIGIGSESDAGDVHEEKPQIKVPEIDTDNNELNTAKEICVAFVVNEQSGADTGEKADVNILETANDFRTELSPENISGESVQEIEVTDSISEPVDIPGPGAEPEDVQEQPDHLSDVSKAADPAVINASVMPEHSTEHITEESIRNLAVNTDGVVADMVHETENTAETATVHTEENISTDVHPQTSDMSLEDGEKREDRTVEGGQKLPVCGGIEGDGEYAVGDTMEERCDVGDGSAEVIDAEMSEFRVLATSSTTDVVEDAAKTRNSQISVDAHKDAASVEDTCIRYASHHPESSLCDTDNKHSSDTSDAEKQPAVSVTEADNKTEVTTSPLVSQQVQLDPQVTASPQVSTTVKVLDNDTNVTTDPGHGTVDIASSKQEVCVNDDLDISAASESILLKASDPSQVSIEEEPISLTDDVGDDSESCTSNQPELDHICAELASSVSHPVSLSGSVLFEKADSAEIPQDITHTSAIPLTTTTVHSQTAPDNLTEETNDLSLTVGTVKETIDPVTAGSVMEQGLDSVNPKETDETSELSVTEGKDKMNEGIGVERQGDILDRPATEDQLQPSLLDGTMSEEDKAVIDLTEGQVVPKEACPLDQAVERSPDMEAEGIGKTNYESVRDNSVVDRMINTDTRTGADKAGETVTRQCEISGVASEVEVASDVVPQEQAGSLTTYQPEERDVVVEEGGKDDIEIPVKLVESQQPSDNVDTVNDETQAEVVILTQETDDYKEEIIGVVKTHELGLTVKGDVDSVEVEGVEKSVEKLADVTDSNEVHATREVPGGETAETGVGAEPVIANKVEDPDVSCGTVQTAEQEKKIEGQVVLVNKDSASGAAPVTATTPVIDGMTAIMTETKDEKEESRTSEVLLKSKETDALVPALSSSETAGMDDVGVEMEVDQSDLVTKQLTDATEATEERGEIATCDKDDQKTAVTVAVDGDDEPEPCMAPGMLVVAASVHEDTSVSCSMMMDNQPADNMTILQHTESTLTTSATEKVKRTESTSATVSGNNREDKSQECKNEAALTETNHVETNALKDEEVKSELSVKVSTENIDNLQRNVEGEKGHVGIIANENKADVPVTEDIHCEDQGDDPQLKGDDQSDYIIVEEQEAENYVPITSDDDRVNEVITSSEVCEGIVANRRDQNSESGIPEEAGDSTSVTTTTNKEKHEATSAEEKSAEVVDLRESNMADREDELIAAMAEAPEDVNQTSAVTEAQDELRGAESGSNLANSEAETASEAEIPAATENKAENSIADLKNEAGDTKDSSVLMIEKVAESNLANVKRETAEISFAVLNEKEAESKIVNLKAGAAAEVSSVLMAGEEAGSTVAKLEEKKVTEAEVSPQVLPTTARPTEDHHEIKSSTEDVKIESLVMVSEQHSSMASPMADEVNKNQLTVKEETELVLTSKEKLDPQLLSTVQVKEVQNVNASMEKVEETRSAVEVEQERIQSTMIDQFATVDLMCKSGTDEPTSTAPARTNKNVVSFMDDVESASKTKRKSTHGKETKSDEFTTKPDKAEMKRRKSIEKQKSKEHKAELKQRRKSIDKQKSKEGKSVFSSIVDTCKSVARRASRTIPAQDLQKVIDKGKSLSDTDEQDLRVRSNKYVKPTESMSDTDDKDPRLASSRHIRPVKCQAIKSTSQKYVTVDGTNPKPHVEEDVTKCEPSQALKGDTKFISEPETSVKQTCVTTMETKTELLPSGGSSTDNVNESNVTSATDGKLTECLEAKKSGSVDTDERRVEEFVIGNATTTSEGVPTACLVDLSSPPPEESASSSGQTPISINGQRVAQNAGLLNRGRAGVLEIPREAGAADGGGRLNLMNGSGYLSPSGRESPYPGLPTIPPSPTPSPVPSPTPSHSKFTDYNPFCGDYAPFAAANGTTNTSNSIPIPRTNGSTHPMSDGPMHVPSSLPTTSEAELGNLRSEVVMLRREVTKYKDVIAKMQEREKSLRDRLSEQAQKHVERGGKFENLNLGDNRPTQIVRRYGNLYSQNRLDTLDALDDLPEMAEYDDLKGKLLFSVVVLSFRSAQQTLRHLRSKIRHLLCLPDSKSVNRGDPVSKEVEELISVYLRKKVDDYNLTNCIQEVSNQVYATLYDYPCLKACEALRAFIEECVRIAWASSVQNPPLVLDFDLKMFDEDLHTRFHASDPDSNQIKSVLWPGLHDGDDGTCLQKGVVIT